MIWSQKSRYFVTFIILDEVLQLTTNLINMNLMNCVTFRIPFISYLRSTKLNDYQLISY